MDARQLKVFCTVAEKKSFSLAAEVLSLTQPTVSFQIASLEHETGTKLLDRGGRVTTLTKGGEILYKYALQILELTEEAQQALQKLKGLLWGEISLGASTIPGEYILPHILQKFKCGHPGIEIALNIGDTKNIIRQVLDNRVEIGVVGATEKNDKLVFTPFTADKLVLIAPANNEWFSGNVATVTELANAPFVMREEGSGTRAIVQQRLTEGACEIDGLHVVMTLGSTEAVKRAVASGAGVSIVSEKAIKNETELGLINSMEIAGMELSRDFFVVYRKQKVLSPAAEVLLQFFKEMHGESELPPGYN